MADFDTTIDAFYRCYAARDAAAAARLYPEDGWHEEIAMGKRRTGRAAIGDGLSGFFGMLPDVTWTEEERIASGDSVAVLYTMCGTFTPRAANAAQSPIPRAVTLKGLHIFEFADGGLRNTKDMWNLDQFKQQMV